MEWKWARVEDREDTFEEDVTKIMTDLGLMKNSKSTRIPAKTDGPLRRSSDAEPFDKAFHYRSIICKLNFLEKSTPPDITLAVHQCARFLVDPRKPQDSAIPRGNQGQGFDFQAR